MCLVRLSGSCTPPTLHLTIYSHASTNPLSHPPLTFHFTIYSNASSNTVNHLPLSTSQHNPKPLHIGQDTHHSILSPSSHPCATSQIIPKTPISQVQNSYTPFPHHKTNTTVKTRTAAFFHPPLTLSPLPKPTLIHEQTQNSTPTQHTT